MNKTIFQLPASGALASTDELEKQVTAGGQSQKLTLAQVLTFIQNNLAVLNHDVIFTGTFQDVLGDFFVGQSGVVNASQVVIGVASIILNTDGSATFSGGNIVMGTNGSASFAGGQTTILSDGTVAVGLDAAIILRPDGSASFAGGNFSIFIDGSATAGSDIEITDTTKGYILRSPNGTRYRLKVDNAGNLGTEAA